MSLDFEPAKWIRKKVCFFAIKNKKSLDFMSPKLIRKLFVGKICLWIFSRPNWYVKKVVFWAKKIINPLDFLSPKLIRKLFYSVSLELTPKYIENTANTIYTEYIQDIYNKTTWCKHIMMCRYFSMTKNGCGTFC